MKTKTGILLIGILIFFSCQKEPSAEKLEMWKEEIATAEANFAKMVAEKGIKDGFVFFAAETAVLERNDKLIKGREAIRQRLAGVSEGEGSSLEWTPDFIDISTSGDLGYTYGQYTYSTIDSLGEKQENKGIFHTVWKRQKDGSWKYVWD